MRTTKISMLMLLALVFTLTLSAKPKIRIMQRAERLPE